MPCYSQGLGHFTTSYKNSEIFLLISGRLPFTIIVFERVIPYEWLQQKMLGKQDSQQKPD
jgi:hypothetical protein